MLYRGRSDDPDNPVGLQGWYYAGGADPQTYRPLRAFHEEREVRRAFEIWPQQSFAALKRGLAGRATTQHYGGVLGSLRADGALERAGPKGHEVWRVRDRSKLMLKRWEAAMRPLPATGVEAARACARRQVANPQDV